jgi:catechol 2,3-dioxygenase-like lactoylglutathione lyase family enzyme
MPSPVGINHVAVEVGDVDQALAFFEQIFGELRLRGRSRQMAFIDLGDQFIAIAAGRTQPPDDTRHIGLVVDDREATIAAARAAGAEIVGGNDIRDPWGNIWQIVDYREVQFTKAPAVLDGMGLAGLGKSEQALEELRAKGLG